MLAAAPFPVLFSPLSTTTTPLDCHRHVVSAKIPTRKDDHPPQDEQQQMGGLAFSAFSTLNSSSSNNSYTPREHHHHQNNNNSGPIGEKGSSPSPRPSPSSSPLSGSDVLLALQRAAAGKSRTRKGKKKGGKHIGSSTRGVEQRPPATAADYGNVRPLNIRSDWADRLDEMERLLQDLQMQHEAHRY